MLAVKNAKVLAFVVSFAVLLDVRSAERPFWMLSEEGVGPGLHLGTKGHFVLSILVWHPFFRLLMRWPRDARWRYDGTRRGNSLRADYPENAHR
jgi:hypothetical protein